MSRYAVSADSQYLVVSGVVDSQEAGQAIPGGWGRSVRAELRDARSGVALRPLVSPNADKVEWVVGFAFSLDSTNVAGLYCEGDRKKGQPQAVAQKRLACWNVATGKLVWKSRYASPAEDLSGISVEFSRDGKYLLVDGDQTRLFDAQTGRLVRTLAIANYLYASASFSPDGNSVVTTGEKDGTKRSKYSTVSATRIRNLQGQLVRTLAGGDSTQAFWSYDGRYLVQLTQQQVKFWDAKGQELIWQVPTLGVNKVVLSRDGSKLGCLSWSSPVGPDTTAATQIEIWDVSTRQKLWEKKTAGFISSLRFSPNSALLLGTGEAPGSNRSIVDEPFYLWDAESGELKSKVTQKGQHPRGQFLPDGSKMILNTSKDVSLWDIP